MGLFGRGQSAPPSGAAAPPSSAPSVTTDPKAAAQQWEARGLVFRNVSRGVPDLQGSLQAYLGGAGLAVGDVDQDGRDDLLLVGGGDLRLFESRTRFLGWAWSALFLDYDNDGQQDIYGVNGFWSGEEADDL